MEVSDVAEIARMEHNLLETMSLPGRSLEQLLDEFARLRSKNLSELRGRHQALGVVTLSELLATWAIHDLTHLHQLSRIMAHQYRNAVGPWSGYLGVLQCASHSTP